MCNLRLLIIDVVHILPSGLDHVYDDRSRFLEFCHDNIFDEDRVSMGFLENCVSRCFNDDHVFNDFRFLEFCLNRVSNGDHVSNDFLEFCLDRVFNDDHVSNDLRFLEFNLDHVSNDLRFLEWKWYSSKCLPSGFQPNELVELNLQYSQIEYLWEGVKYLDKLKCIDLKYCYNLVRTPEFIGVPRLERIYLSECFNLVEIHPSIGKLSELEVLDLRGCGRLQSLPKLPSTVRYINAERCKSLEPSPTLLETGILSDPCSQWCRYRKSNCGVAFTILNRYLQGNVVYSVPFRPERTENLVPACKPGRLSPKAGHETCTKRKEDGSGAEFQIIYPAYESLQWPWLTHQSMEENSISMELPPNWCNSRWMGLALCAFFYNKGVPLPSRGTVDLIAHETALGDMPHSHYTFEISSIGTFDGSHIWLLYLSRDTGFATARNGECSQIRVSFKIYGGGLFVLNCGARLVYEQDVEEFNQTIAQCESSHIED
uniref:C-JID domain-containing protein n=1 Tax=Fagus sylvatica TaxID=28930 RepID=A0A2N9HJ52_FAGSY